MLSLVLALGSRSAAVPFDLALSGISLDGNSVDYNGEALCLALEGTLHAGQARLRVSLSA